MAQCMFPYHVENPKHFRQEDRLIPVPCGKCPDCLKRRTSVWSYRLRKEEERSVSSLFVTLTYDTTLVPISPNGFMTLCKRDVQLFFKRLRKLHPPQLPPIKYYIVGEYGSQRKRPHYHAIIFNANEFDILKAWVDPFEKTPIGQVDIGTVTGASIGYTVKYINKGHWRPMHKNDDRVPEFSLMSKKLGSAYLSPNVVKYHHENLSKAYITLEDGIIIALPRYYKDKIFPVTIPQRLLQDEYFLELHPSILPHLAENQILRDKQNLLVKAAIEAAPKPIMSDLEIHQSKAAAIKNYKRLNGKRKDI